jgi:hypothetical protein
MTLGKLRAWWRGLPTKTRVKWIAGALLVLAGAEVVVMAPFIFELAVLIDAVGVMFVLAAGWAAMRQTWLLYWTRLYAITRGVGRLADRIANLGAGIPIEWHLCIMSIGTRIRRIAAGAALVSSALVILGRLKILW